MPIFFTCSSRPAMAGPFRAKLPVPVPLFFPLVVASPPRYFLTMRIYQLVFARRALDDLQALLDRVQPHALAWAKRIHTDLRRDARQLKKFHHLGPPSPMIAGLRGLVSGPFRIYYEVDDAAQTIRIYRFWSTLQGDPGEDDIF